MSSINSAAPAFPEQHGLDLHSFCAASDWQVESVSVRQAVPMSDSTHANPDSHDTFDKEMTILRHFGDTCANTTGYSAHVGGEPSSFQEMAYSFPRNRSSC
jgi:hypothetical protein